MIQQSDLARAWRLTPRAITSLVRRGCPLTSVEAATSWRELNCPRGHFHKAVKKEKVPGQPDVLALKIKSLEHAVESYLLQVNLSAQDLDAARKDGSPGAIRLALTGYSQAIQELAEVESRHKRFLREAGILISFDEAKAKFVGIAQELRNLLDAMPRSLASRCNPSDPELARAAIQEYIELTIYKQLSKHEKPEEK